MAKKILCGLVGFVFGLTCILSLILCAAQGVIFNTERFMIAYEKENIGEVTGMDDENLRLVTDHMLDYLCDKEENFNLTAVIHGESREVFGDREVRHMVDVKELFLAAFDIRTGCIITAVLCLAALILLLRKRSLSYLSIGYLAALAVIGILLGIMGYYVATDFNRFFMNFHFMFFDNDLWLLDPRYEVLIQMLPESFFNSVVVALIGWGAASVLIPAAAAVSALIVSAKRKKA